MKKLNWAIIGCGVISSSHLDAVKMLDNAYVYAVCDIDKEAAQKAFDKYEAKKLYTDYKEMLADPEVDVVSICTPSGMHAEMAIDAANAGKHIFCEKPMDVTSEKMTAMVDAVEKSGVKCGCVFQRRTWSEAANVRKFIDEHDLGPVIYADATVKFYRSPEYYKSAGWRATWELDGGGALMNQGVHGVDLLRWFAGDVKTVYAMCRTLSRDIPVEDAAAAVLEFKNGAIGTIRGATCVYPNQNVEICLHFKTGTIIFGDAGVTCCEFEDKSLKIEDTASYANNASSNPAALGDISHFALAQDLADAIINDRDPMVVPREARKSVDLILAIYESSRKNAPINL